MDRSQAHDSGTRPVGRRTSAPSTIEHHQGAIAMAGNELTSGSNADALALATSIQATQQAQISQMRGMLDK